MQVFLRRDSVAAGDDANAPHDKTITVPDGSNIETIINIVVKSGYLPSIQGGKATWSATSKIPLAVIAQEWESPRRLLYYSIELNKLDMVNKSLRLHLTYYAQLDPQIVFETLQRWLLSELSNAS
jgi:hypothetical protein